MEQRVVGKGITVVMAGAGINLALGILYTWSVFKGAIKQSIQEDGPASFSWDPAQLNDPYAVCCLGTGVAVFLRDRKEELRREVRFQAARLHRVGV